MKLTDIVSSVLDEEKDTTPKAMAKKALKIFYNTDILIQGFADKRAEASGTEEEKPEEKTPPEEDITATEGTLYEEIIKTSSNGELAVPMNEVDNIQTLDDLVDYLGDAKVGGKPVLNNLVEEIILSAAGVGAKPLDSIVNEGDKIFVDIDYGKEKNDSIGIRVNKQSGSTALSVTIKKDNKIIPGEFNIEEFNKQLVYYRNSMFDTK